MMNVLAGDNETFVSTRSKDAFIVLPEQRCLNRILLKTLLNVHPFNVCSVCFLENVERFFLLPYIYFHAECSR